MIEAMDEELQADLVSELLEYGIENKRILDVMRTLYRADFMPSSHLLGFDPYEDAPAAIGEGQTISQPYMVAYMSELLNPKQGMSILEIGTGSGYQAAILARLGAEVYSVERIEALYEHSQKILEPYGVHQLLGDGAQGWAAHAPYDAILVACAAEEVPPALCDQLAEGGIMLIPVGTDTQQLKIITKKEGVIQSQSDVAVTFVPLVEKK